MTDREYASGMTEALKKLYPSATCALSYEGEPWKLLVMGRLSAQCTDARVNLVCVDLFRKYPTAEALGNADLTDVEDCIRSCGLYKMKAKDIVGECKMLTEEYNGILPSDMDTLLKFPGVGRKIANLLLGDIYKLPAVVVDTHCIRISRRMGLVSSEIAAPEKIEVILKNLIAPEEQSDFCHRIVLLGREYCPAKGYDCSACPLCHLCRKVRIS